MTCPGFRNLVDALFRDDTERTIQKAQRWHGQVESDNSPSKSSSSSSSQTTTPQPFQHVTQTSTSFPDLPVVLTHALTQPIADVAAPFYFAKFTCNEPPGSADHQRWLQQAYHDAPFNHPLRTAIEAVGMAGLSNFFYAPEVEAQAKSQYGRALAVTKAALRDPVLSLEDTTLATVLLLSHFEVGITPFREPLVLLDGC